MTAVILLFLFAIIGAIVEIIWLNSDWIAPGGWRSWLICKWRKHFDD